MQSPCEAMPSVAYGFIGIGRMGLPMALNLRAKIPSASKLVVLDINKAQVDELVKQSRSLGLGQVQVASSAKEVAEECNIIITSLAPGKPVEQVFADPSTGMLAAQINDKSRLVIDTSTMDIESSLKLAKLVTDSGFGDFVDCPVSGGMEFAKRGELSSMIGASKELFDRVLPVALSFSGSDKIYHCGPLGSGLAAKIINNYIATISYVGLCEGMNTGVRYGLDPKVLTDVINASSGMSWNSMHMCPIKGVQATSSASRDFKSGPDGGPGLDLANESTEMAVDLMSHVNAKSVMAPVMRDIWKRAAESPLCQGKEYRSVYKLFSEEDGHAISNGVQN